jgi:multidrug efflux pump subunit AcrB
MLNKFLNNHVLANLTFALVLVIGTISYLTLPRQKDPDINFNWIVVTTLLPGASASDVESQITDPLERALKTLQDIKFISSNSRESVSSLLVRFNQIDERTYDKHVSDLRREIQNIESDFPAAATTPKVLEIVSANAFPAATVLIKGIAYDENLRLQAKHVIDDLKRLPGVDRVDNYGLNDPEIQILFDSQKLIAQGINPTDIADSIRTLFQDLSAGSITAGHRKWLVRLAGKQPDPGDIATMPLLAKSGYIPLSELARVERGEQKASRLVSSNGTPTILAAVLKQAGANTLKLVQNVQDYIDTRNRIADTTGVELALVDDQSEVTRHALNIMQTNAIFGLSFVLIITFAFLGFRIAVVTTIGIPFILAATFWVLSGIGQTLNVSVLLAVVIALGMLVDDAVVVAEASYHRIAFGEKNETAVINALKEVFAPVTTAVLTTMAAFMPLVLLPGILGEFMRVIPLVVTIALMISLIEAYWMLPAHMLAMRFDLHKKPSRSQRWRNRMNRAIRIFYTRRLISVLRYPKTAISVSILLFILAVAVMASPLIKKDFFASDTFRLFYINVEMKPTSVLEDTHRKVAQIEQMTRQRVQSDEFREMVSYAGIMFTRTEPLFGNQYGQILVGLKPRGDGMRRVEQILDDLRPELTKVSGVEKVSFLKLTGGPPTSRAISVKVRGDNYAEITRATNELEQALAQNPLISDITDDASRGSSQMTFKLNYEVIQRLGINPQMLARTLSMAVDGEIVGDIQIEGEKVQLRVQNNRRQLPQIGDLLQQVVFTREGKAVPLSMLVSAQSRTSLGNIRHYNFKRAITLEADIDKAQTDTVAANDFVKQAWGKMRHKYPNVNLDFSGILDDITEALNSIAVLFIFGVGIMYMILGTQFKSYFQPLMILSTVFMAFTGVVIGILIARQPLSLFTMYGIVALAGIAVNSAIVLISTANDKLASGMSLLHSTVYAARRRVIPIIITTLTTIGGLFSLATGLGGESLIWGPVANAIVWGLGFSATLTLFIIPILYRLFMSNSRLLRESRRA